MNTSAALTEPYATLLSEGFAEKVELEQTFCGTTAETKKATPRAAFLMLLRSSDRDWEGGTRTRNPSVNSRMLCH